MLLCQAVCAAASTEKDEDQRQECDLHVDFSRTCETQIALKVSLGDHLSQSMQVHFNPSEVLCVR